jgi:hypothetical protein
VKKVIIQYEQFQGQSEAQERIEKRREFVSGLLDFLKATHPGENVHVWVNDVHYLGCFIWGFAMHWRWGASDMNTKDVHEISKTAKVVRLASSKPVPQYSGLAA